MAKIFLSMPILDRPEMDCINSMISASHESKHDVHLNTMQNNAVISYVRNHDISLFINRFEEYDYFATLDSDLIVNNWRKGDNYFDKLVDHDEDFVGALYSKKEEGNILQGLPLYVKDLEPKHDTGLINMRWMAGGAWLIKRSAIMKLHRAYPGLTCTGDRCTNGLPMYALNTPGVFDVGKDENGVEITKFLGDDWSMCERFNLIGGSIYADTSIRLGHVGKKIYNLWEENDEQSCNNNGV